MVSVLDLGRPKPYPAPDGLKPAPKVLKVGMLEAHVRLAPPGETFNEL